MKLTMKFIQASLYILCVFFLLSIGYDMAYACIKIYRGDADFLYITIFLIMALIQIFLLSSMIYAIKKRAQNISSYLGRYLFFAPLLFGALYIAVEKEDVFVFASYVLPMFHKAASDLSNVLFKNADFLLSENYIWIALVLIYGITLMLAARIYRKSERNIEQHF